MAGQGLRTYASHYINGSKSAIQVVPIAPTFKSNQGQRSSYLTAASRGMIKLQWVTRSAGVKANWQDSNEGYFNVEQLGRLGSVLNGTVPTASWDWKPNPNFENASKDNSRRFEFNRVPEGVHAVFYNNEQKTLDDIIPHESVYVLKTIVDYSIPRLCGLDKLFEATNVSDQQQGGQQQQNYNRSSNAQSGKGNAWPSYIQ